MAPRHGTATTVGRRIRGLAGPRIRSHGGPTPGPYSRLGRPTGYRRCSDRAVSRADALSAVYVQPAAVRWRGRIAPDLIDGQTLCHTDVTPLNFLVGPGVVRLVDWSMPIRGAAWIDAALMIVRLIRAGHTPAQSESWADQIPPWKQARPEAVGIFVSALADLWEQRLRENPVPHRRQLAEAAQAWTTHRIHYQALPGLGRGLLHQRLRGQRVRHLPVRTQRSSHRAAGLLVSRRPRPQSHHRVRRQHNDAMRADIGPRCHEPEGLGGCVSAVGAPRTTGTRQPALVGVRQDSVRRPQS